MIPDNIVNIYATHCNADLQCDPYFLRFFFSLTLHGILKMLPLSGLKWKQYFEKPEDGTGF